MTENMKKFLELLSQKKDLPENINSMGKEEIIALAKAMGAELTEADFVRNKELDDDELAAVSGGDAWCLLLGFGVSQDKLHSCDGIGVGFNSFYIFY